MTPSEFAQLVRSHDGVDAFNEASRMALADELAGRVDVVVHDGPRIVAMAHARPGAPVEFAVHPRDRRRGHGTALLDRLIGDGETQFWAHGDTDGARGLAAACALEPARTLLRLTRPASAKPGPANREPSGIVIRPFREDDLPQLLAINARAFASHPEQGRMDRAEFDRRTASGWFDPAGIVVAERDGTVIGFHWTKIELPRSSPLVGEVYVLAVDPDAARSGVGSSLLAAGLGHLAAAGADTVELYVEGDNTPALALYGRHGFAEAGRDVLYVSTMPASVDRGPS